MNKYIANGRITKEIELRTTTNGKSVVSNAIAVKNDFKNANGEYDKEFVNIQAWNATAEYLSKYVEKGDMILVEGRLTTRSYDAQDGIKKYVTEVVCEKVELLAKKKSESGQAPKGETQAEILKEAMEEPSEDIFAEFQTENQEMLDSLELPF